MSFLGGGFPALGDEPPWLPAWRAEWQRWERLTEEAIQHSGGVTAEHNRLRERVRSAARRAHNQDFVSRETMLAERAQIEAELARVAALPQRHEHDQRAQVLVRRLDKAGAPTEQRDNLYRLALELTTRVRNGQCVSSEAAEREWLHLEEQVLEFERVVPRRPSPAEPAPEPTASSTAALPPPPAQLDLAQAPQSSPTASPRQPGARARPDGEPEIIAKAARAARGRVVTNEELQQRLVKDLGKASENISASVSRAISYHPAELARAEDPSGMAGVRWVGK